MLLCKPQIQCLIQFAVLKKYKIAKYANQRGAWEIINYKINSKIILNKTICINN